MDSGFCQAWSESISNVIPVGIIKNNKNKIKNKNYKNRLKLSTSESISELSKSLVFCYLTSV